MIWPDSTLWLTFTVEFAKEGLQFIKLQVQLQV